MALTKYRLGDLIQQRREKYDGTEQLPSWGVSKDGFIQPRQDGADTSIYNVYYKNDFVFNPARMELNSIALNQYFDKAICSSLYEVFFVTRTDIVLPEYLNIYIKRDEFARKCWFEAIGSARNYFRVANLSEFEIQLPSIPIQQKYVDIYNAMLVNQQSYEKGLGDLKLVCDMYVETLKKIAPLKNLASYLILCENVNSDLAYGASDVRGVNNTKELMPSKSDLNGRDLSKFQIVYPGDFVFNHRTSRNGSKFSIAYNDGKSPIICTEDYVVFRIKPEYQTQLIAQWLYMFFNRSEFDRYVITNSWGSSTEFFNFTDLCEVEIPVPDIKIQQDIVDIFKAYNTRKEIAEKLKAQIQNICPILIKGSIEEGMRTNEA